MKRFLILMFAMVFVFTLSAFAVSADTYALIPTDAEWKSAPNGGCEVTVAYNDDGSVVFSGSAYGTWPATETTYDGFTVNINDYSLVYDFTVEVGNTNINLYFGSQSYTLCNSEIGATVYDTGSGDLGAGTYKGVMKLTELVESTKLYDGSAFPTSAIVEDTLTFTGIQVYSVGGAVITVHTLEIVPNDEAPAEETSAESSEESSVDDPVSESEESSEEPIVEESAKSEPAESSAKADSVPAEESDGDDGSDNALMITIVAIVVVVAVIVVTVVLVLRKKKQ